MTSQPSASTTPMVVVGANCTWWDNADKAAMIGPGGVQQRWPVCPHCLGDLRQPVSEEAWNATLAQYEASGLPDYAAVMAWGRGRCFPDMLAAGEAYAKAKGAEYRQRVSQMHTEPGFRITGGTGFSITFDNGWSASMQIGMGNYCSNRPYARLYSEEESLAAAAKGCGTCEVMIIDPAGAFIRPDCGAGWRSPEQVLAILQTIAAKPAMAEA